MKILFIVFMAIFMIITSGCALNPENHTMVVLQNTETKEIKECRSDGWTTWNMYAEVEACSKAYEKAGFKILGQY